MSKVQTFEKPKRVAERDKLIGCRFVAQIAAIRYADETGLVDERLCLILDEDTVLSFPKTQFEPLKEEAKKQVMMRYRLQQKQPGEGLGKKPGILPVKPVAHKKEKKEEASVVQEA